MTFMLTCVTACTRLVEMVAVGRNSRQMDVLEPVNMSQCKFWKFLKMEQRNVLWLVRLSPTALFPGNFFWLPSCVSWRNSKFLLNQPPPCHQSFPSAHKWLWMIRFRSEPQVSLQHCPDLLSRQTHEEVVTGFACILLQAKYTHEWRLDAAGEGWKFFRALHFRYASSANPDLAWLLSS